MKKPFKISKRKKIILGLLILLIIWIAADLLYLVKRNINNINAEETARMDAAM